MQPVLQAQLVGEGGPAGLGTQQRSSGASFLDGAGEGAGPRAFSYWALCGQDSVSVGQRSHPAVVRTMQEFLEEWGWN